MKECPATHRRLPALFDPEIPDSPVAWAVFKGHHKGRAMVDDLNFPTQCVLRTDAQLTFCSHRVGQELLDEAVAFWRQTVPVWLVWPSPSGTPAQPPKPSSIGERLEFSRCDPLSPGLTVLRERLPVGTEVRTIDRALLQKCQWREEMEFFCGSVENFLEHGKGLCLTRGGEIISEAYASSMGEHHAEIGAVTPEAYRGQGLAPIACAFLIEELAHLGYRPLWSCDRDNQASIRVAQKLGFARVRPYQVLYYDSSA